MVLWAFIVVSTSECWCAGMFVVAWLMTAIWSANQAIKKQISVGTLNDFEQRVQAHVAS
jgi:hypothetical protein